MINQLIKKITFIRANNTLTFIRAYICSHIQETKKKKNKIGT